MLLLLFLLMIMMILMVMAGWLHSCCAVYSLNKQREKWSKFTTEFRYCSGTVKRTSHAHTFAADLFVALILTVT